MDYNLISYTSYKNKYYPCYKANSVEYFLNMRNYQQFYSISDINLFEEKKPLELAKSILDSLIKDKRYNIKGKDFIYRVIYPNMLLRDYELIIYKKEY